MSIFKETFQNFVFNQLTIREAANITVHVPRLIPVNIFKLAISTSEDVLLCLGTDNPNQLSFSGTNDVDDFSSTGSGSVVIEDKIIGLQSFRDDLIIFCLNSIHRLENINNSSTIAVVPVTKT